MNKQRKVMRGKSNSILIIIDLQKGFVTEHSDYVVKPIEQLQEIFDHVVYTKFHNPDPSPFRKILDYQKLPPGSEDTQLAFKVRQDAYGIDRPYYTCVTSALKKYLQELGAKEVYICGIATEACVLKSVLDLFESDIRTWIIEDLCASDQDKHYHDIALELIGKLISKEHIIKESVVRQVLKTAA